jgi:two-component system KDP operon response regulator KdpE
MEGTALASQQSVLIVDRCEETREVLRTALERRGLRIFTTPRRRQGLELARRHRLDLIVLDLELDCADGEESAAPLVRQSQTDCTPLVVLGTVRRRSSPLPGREFIAKPYHYGPLIRKIEELLSTTQQTPARSA